MIKASLLIGSALAATSLMLAAPAVATPAPTPGLSDATSTASAAPGSLGGGMPNPVIRIQDADLKSTGARVGDDTADGYYSKAATDGTILKSDFYKPAT